MHVGQVKFTADGPASPRLLLLPGGCHVLAPRYLADAPFLTEFGALLEAGESFGWMGDIPAATDGEMRATAAPTGQGTSTTEQVRNTRIVWSKGVHCAHDRLPSVLPHDMMRDNITKSRLIVFAGASSSGAAIVR